MTDKELRELESLAIDQDRLFDPCAVIALIAEVRRLNRMVDKAVVYLEHSCCDAPQSFDCEEINRDCRDCWKEYLESEVVK